MGKANQIIASSRAHPNIAFIKYWGNRDPNLRLPENGSISMNLETLYTETRIIVNPDLHHDVFILNGKNMSGLTFERVHAFLDLIRNKASSPYFAEVTSINNFPSSAGIASSASAFAALAVAAASAYKLDLEERELSTLARMGSGSASRSVPAGFVEWYASNIHNESYAETIAPPEHWELWDCIALIEKSGKKVGSTQGHLLAGTSILQPARVAGAPSRLNLCRSAILQKDFQKLADIIELDSNLMHAVMMTSNPPLMYWKPESILIMNEVMEWRKNGLEAAYTLDAGPNVHVICTNKSRLEVQRRLKDIPCVLEVLPSPPGGGAVLLPLSQD